VSGYSLWDNEAELKATLNITGATVQDEHNKDTSTNMAKGFPLNVGERESVKTSQGAFYARHITIGDLKVLNDYVEENADRDSSALKALGKHAIETLICTDSESEQGPAIADKIYELLTRSDIASLATAIAKSSEFTLLTELEPLEALGSAILAFVTENVQQYAEITQSFVESNKRLMEGPAEIQRTLQKSFGSLSATLKSALGNNLSGLAVARENLNKSSAVEALRQSLEKQNALFGGHSAIRDAQMVSSTDRLIRSGLNGLERINAGLPKGSFSDSEKLALFAEPSISKLDMTHLRPPPFEETAAGQAAARAANASEGAVRQLGEVTGLVGQMASQMEKLQTMFLTEVLPEWHTNLEGSAKSASTALVQAERSLFWAKWALIASVVVTVLMTVWQVWIAHDYNLENDIQQNTSELLMRQQLAASQELNKQLAGESKLLREELVDFKQSVGTLQVEKLTKPGKQIVDRPSR
jgi:hypothetical protein